jgi:hypothetical protein
VGRLDEHPFPDDEDDPSRKSCTRASSHPENSACIASCAAAVGRSTFEGNLSGAYS